MISRKEDYSYLLNELGKYSNNFKLLDGKIVDNNGKEFEDESIVTKIKFYLLYANAYKYNDDNSFRDEDILDGDYYQGLILCSYDMFNYLINVFIKEYQVYGDIGTGNVIYYPYQKMADYLIGKNFVGDHYYFQPEQAKETVIDYIKTVFDLENCKRRVK